MTADDNILWAGSDALVALIRERTVSVVEVVEAYLRRIDQLDALNATITVPATPHGRPRKPPTRRSRGATEPSVSRADRQIQLAGSDLVLGDDRSQRGARGRGLTQCGQGAVPPSTPRIMPVT